MKAFVITLANNEYSNQVADRCIQSAVAYGLEVVHFFGIDNLNAVKLMEAQGLKWTWADNNTKKTSCPVTHLEQFPYSVKDLRKLIGCTMSHFMLWKKCVELDEPILILEHDAVFISQFSHDIQFNGICQINDPGGATRKGNWWRNEIIKRGTVGVHEKTWVTTENERMMPDGLAGGSAYMIKPWAAQELINKFQELGVWPNDALMCKQLFPYLEEYYPFITKVIQTQSTTMG